MKFYTENVPEDIVTQLREIGMHITESYHLHQPSPGAKGLVKANFKELDLPTYAEVFDWFMSNGIKIGIVDSTSKMPASPTTVSYSAYVNGSIAGHSDTWTGAAIKIIKHIVNERRTQKVMNEKKQIKSETGVIKNAIDTVLSPFVSDKGKHLNTCNYCVFATNCTVPEGIFCTAGHLKGSDSYRYSLKEACPKFKPGNNVYNL